METTNVPVGGGALTATWVVPFVFAHLYALFWVAKVLLLQRPDMPRRVWMRLKQTIDRIRSLRSCQPEQCSRVGINRKVTGPLRQPAQDMASCTSKCDTKLDIAAARPRLLVTQVSMHYYLLQSPSSPVNLVLESHMC